MSEHRGARKLWSRLDWSLARREWASLTAIFVLALSLVLPFAEFLPATKLIFQVFYVVFWVLVGWRLHEARGTRNPIWRGFEAIFLTYTLVPICQILLPLPRPANSPLGIEILYGFPSGHAVALFSLAWIVGACAHSRTPAWFAMAVVIALSRVSVGYHFAYQVVGGALLGLILGAYVARRPFDLLLTWRMWQFVTRVTRVLFRARRQTSDRDSRKSSRAD